MLIQWKARGNSLTRLAVLRLWCNLLPRPLSQHAAMPPSVCPSITWEPLTYKAVLKIRHRTLTVNSSICTFFRGSKLKRWQFYGRLRKQQTVAVLWPLFKTAIYGRCSQVVCTMPCFLRPCTSQGQIVSNGQEIHYSKLVRLEYFYDSYVLL